MNPDQATYHIRQEIRNVYLVGSFFCTLTDDAIDWLVNLRRNGMELTPRGSCAIEHACRGCDTATAIAYLSTICLFERQRIRGSVFHLWTSKCHSVIEFTYPAHWPQGIVASNVLPAYTLCTNCRLLMEPWLAEMDTEFAPPGERKRIRADIEQHLIPDLAGIVACYLFDDGRPPSGDGFAVPYRSPDPRGGGERNEDQETRYDGPVGVVRSIFHRTYPMGSTFFYSKSPTYGLYWNKPADFRYIEHEYATSLSPQSRHCAIARIPPHQREVGQWHWDEKRFAVCQDPSSGGVDCKWSTLIVRRSQNPGEPVMVIGTHRGTLAQSDDYIDRFILFGQEKTGAGKVVDCLDPSSGGRLMQLTGSHTFYSKEASKPAPLGRATARPHRRRWWRKEKPTRFTRQLARANDWWDKELERMGRPASADTRSIYCAHYSNGNGNEFF